MDDKMMNDDFLLRQFFNEAAQQQIEDNGFTDRVMQLLPATPGVENTFAASPSTATTFKGFNRLWTAFCLVVFAVLFVVFNGWQLLAVHFEVMLRTLAVESFTVNPLMLAVVLFGLLFVGVGEVISSETVRR